MNVQACLDRYNSYLREENFGSQPISLFLNRRCKSYNINPRVLLTLLELRAGLLSRKTKPEEKVTNWCLGMIPKNSAETGLDYCKGLRMQIEAALSMLESFFLEGRFNKDVPMKFETMELPGQNAASYSIIQFLWVTDNDVSIFGRFSETYEKLFGNDPRRDHDGAVEGDKRKAPRPNTRVSDTKHSSVYRPLSASGSNVWDGSKAMVS